MKAFRIGLMIVVLLVAAYARMASPPHGSAASGAASSPSQVADQAAIPSRALDVLAYVRRTGEAPEGYVGGRVFQNREGHLPSTGDYREFDVDPHRGGRNADRIVVEWNTKKAWYTDDHYTTFVPMP